MTISECKRTAGVCSEWWWGDVGGESESERERMSSYLKTAVYECEDSFTLLFTFPTLRWLYWPTHDMRNIKRRWEMKGKLGKWRRKVFKTFFSSFSRSWKKYIFYCVTRIIEPFSKCVDFRLSRKAFNIQQSIPPPCCSNLLPPTLLVFPSFSLCQFFFLPFFFCFSSQCHLQVPSEKFQSTLHFTLFCLYALECFGRQWEEKKKQ